MVISIKRTFSFGGKAQNSSCSTKDYSSYVARLESCNLLSAFPLIGLDSLEGVKLRLISSFPGSSVYVSHTEPGYSWNYQKLFLSKWALSNWSGAKLYLCMLIGRLMPNTYLSCKGTVKPTLILICKNNSTVWLPRTVLITQVFLSFFFVKYWYLMLCTSSFQVRVIESFINETRIEGAWLNGY